MFSPLHLSLQLLQQDPKKRPSTLEELKNHDYFSDINWEAVERREVQPSFVPSVSIHDELGLEFEIVESLIINCVALPIFSHNCVANLPHHYL